MPQFKMKEKMSSFDIAALIFEFNQTIKGARIENIYQINRPTILLKLHQRNQPPIYLLAEAGKRIHTTSYAVKRPAKPTSFCMSLRKHLKNGRITELYQREFERTVVIHVNTKDGEFQLISELFGDGNIIVVDPENKILQALFYREMKDRTVRRGETFQHAPPSGKNPLRLTLQEFEEIKEFGKLEVVRALTKFLSIGGLYAEETLLRAKVDKDKPCEDLLEQEIEEVFNQIRQMVLTVVEGKIEPQGVWDDAEGWFDVTPVSMKSYADAKQRPYKTFNEAVDEFYMKSGLKEEVAEVTDIAERDLAKQRRILQSQQKALSELREKKEENKKIGDAIYMHFNELQFLLQRVMDEKRSGRSWKEIASGLEKEREAGLSPAVYFQSLDSKILVLNISVEEATFPLALRHSVQTNAATYYAKAKKAERKLEGAEKALQETENNIQKLQHQKLERLKEAPKPPLKKRKRVWYEKFRWFYSSDGFLVIGGRDATTNEILIKKHMEPFDAVFHADVHGAPFVLIKTEGKTLPERTMKEAAQLAASYSRAWKEKLRAVDVYWFSPQQISKTPPSGQYLEKGAFVISGKKNYVRGVPLEIAVGIKSVKGERLMVIGGPKEAVAEHTDVYVEVIPGEKSSGMLAKEIRRLLAKKAPETAQKRIFEVPLEDIQSFIPSGEGEVKMNALE